MFRRLQGESGLTLLELIITLAAMLIIAGVTLTAWSSYVPVYALNNSARMISAQLRLSRMHSVTEERISRVVFDSPNRRLWRWVDMDEDGLYNAAVDRRYGEVKLDHGIFFCGTCNNIPLPMGGNFNDPDGDGLNSNASGVTFTPRGTTVPVQSNAWIVLIGVEQEQLRAINISSTTGDVAIFIWDGSAWFKS